MKIKDQIEEYEYYQNGFNNLCGNAVKVVNLRKRKDKYIADVILIEQESGNRERYNNCEYGKELFNEDI